MLCILYSTYGFLYSLSSLFTSISYVGYGKHRSSFVITVAVIRVPGSRNNTEANLQVDRYL
jgi:hypothetical protein